MIHSILWRLPSLFLVLLMLSTSFWSSIDHHYLDWFPGHDHLFVMHTHTHQYDGGKTSTAFHYHNLEDSNSADNIGQTVTVSFVDDDVGSSFGFVSMKGFDKELEKHVKFTSVRTLFEDLQNFPLGINSDVLTPPPINKHL
mgnify:FL=1